MSERLYSAVMAGVTIASLGCISASERTDVPVLQAEAAIEPGRVHIDPEQLIAPHEELPDAVSRIVGSAVAMHISKVRYDPKPDGTLGQRISKGSASGGIVDIGQERVWLSAAHVVRGPVGACGANRVEMDLDGDTGSAAKSVGYERQSPAPPQPLRGITLFTSHDGLDAAVLLPKNKKDLLPDQPTPQLQEEVDTPPGTVLFAVNYEPTEGGRQRAPSVKGALGSPAVYAHVVLEQTPTHIISFVGVKGYGPTKDAYQRPGASGGALVEKDGGHAGVVSGGLGNHTEAEVEEKYNVDVPPGEYSLKVTRKVPVATAEALLDKAEAAPKCVDPLDPRFLVD
jgi:hypothetical protein